MTDFLSRGIEDLDLTFNADGWGPVNGDRVLLPNGGSIPYAHFDKKEKCSRIADFVQSSYTQYQKPYQRYRRDDANADFAYKHDAAEEGTFQLVDTSKTQTKSRGGGALWARPWGADGRALWARPWWARWARF